MNNAGVLVSVLVGVLCGALGVAARPRVPDAENKTRTLITAVVAAVPVVCWMLWLGHPLAAPAGFVAGTLLIGSLRDQLLKISTRSNAPADADAESAQPQVLQIPEAVQIPQVPEVSEAPEVSQEESDVAASL